MAHPEEKKNDLNNWSKLPNNPAKYFSKPVYWLDRHGKERIFVCADYDDPTVKSKIQSYCINDLTWSESVDYPKNAKPYRFTVSIDSKQGLLYIYGGAFACFLQYNLKQKKWIILSKNGQHQEQDIANKYNIQKTGWYPASVFIDKNINQFHVFSGLTNKNHLIWDKTSKKMKEAYEFEVVNLFGHNALWISSQSTLLILGGIKGWGGHSNDILSCEITSSKQQTFSWKQYKNGVQLPFSLGYFGCICYNDRILILFGGEKADGSEINDIWCLDTMKTENGWIRSPVKCPRIGRFYAIQTSKNMVHLFQMSDNAHFVTDINKIIPPHMVLLYKNNLEENKNDDDNEYLQRRVNVLESKLANLNDLYKILQDDHQILRQEYERQGKELRRFRKEYGFDEKNYLTWNSDKIVDWIISLEWPRYCKYEFNLRRNLKKENVDGEILGYVNRTDWTRFGIHDIKDKINLEKHLKKLIPNYNVAQQNNDNDNNDNVEVEQEEGKQTFI